MHLSAGDAVDWAMQSPCCAQSDGCGSGRTQESLLTAPAWVEEAAKAFQGRDTELGAQKMKRRKMRVRDWKSGGWPGKGSSKCEGNNDTREHAWSVRGECKASSSTGQV